MKSLEDSQVEVAVSKSLEPESTSERLDEAFGGPRCQAEALAMFSREAVRIFTGEEFVWKTIWRQEDPTVEWPSFHVRVTHEWGDKVFTGN